MEAMEARTNITKFIKSCIQLLKRVSDCWVLDFARFVNPTSQKRDVGFTGTQVFHFSHLEIEMSVFRSISKECPSGAKVPLVLLPFLARLKPCPFKTSGEVPVAIDVRLMR